MKNKSTALSTFDFAASPIISESLEKLKAVKQNLEVNEMTGAVKISTRGLESILGVNQSNIVRLAKTVKNSDAQTKNDALLTLSLTGFGTDAQNQEITDIQLACLASYYSNNAKVSAETRKNCQQLSLAFSAIGVRTLAYMAAGKNLDYTPVAAGNRKVNPDAIIQSAGRPIATEKYIESALKNQGVDYFQKIKLQDCESLSHTGFQKLDFYCPDVGEYGLAIKGYFQNGGGSGYEKISTYLMETQHRYPCPSILIFSGKYLVENKHVQKLISFVRSYQSPTGKLRAVVCAEEESLDSSIQDTLAWILERDARAEKLTTAPGRRLAPKKFTRTAATF